MFTDGPVTPMRVETFINTIRQLGTRKLDREKLLKLHQPEGLPGLKEDSRRDQAARTFTAARELGLIEVEDSGRVQLSFDRNDSRLTRTIVLEALDEQVLGGSLETEPYFALFYSFLLSLGKEGTTNRSGDEWAVEFERAVFAGERPPNPFNSTKYSGLLRWFHYSGLGWHDSKGIFQANPFDRVLRRLPVIFDDKKELSSEEFMAGLSESCPELDGGDVFKRAHAGWNPEGKNCTLGLSHALVELHAENKIRLHCPRDSRGWSIIEADPPTDQTVRSYRIEKIELM